MNTAIDNRNTAGKAAWICLVIAWICFLVPIPLLGTFIGWPLNLVAFILAIVAMSKGGTRAGLFQLLASLLVSPALYFAGSFLMMGLAAWGAQSAAPPPH